MQAANSIGISNDSNMALFTIQSEFLHRNITTKNNHRILQRQITHYKVTSIDEINFTLKLYDPLIVIQK